MLSVMNTSIYLAETVVSDLFIVRLSDPFLSTRVALISIALSQLYRCYIVWNASLAVVAFPVLLYIADIGMPHLTYPNHIDLTTHPRNWDRGRLHPDPHRDECRLQQEARENHKCFLLLHSRPQCRLHRSVFVPCIRLRVNKNS